eukprot:g6800.t1
MVLQELGSKLTSALRRLHTDTVVDKETIKAVVGDICRALLESDVNVQIVMKLRKNVEAKAEALVGDQQDGARGAGRGAAQQRRSIQKAVVDELTGMLDPKTAPYKMKKGRSNVVMFVGLQGAGKTTTIAKFAHYWQRKGWKVAMVCADTFRAGAFDQLKQNATKLRCPFYGSYSEADPVRIADEGVMQFKQEKYEVIIVDTSGRHKQEDALFDEMQEIQEAVQPDNTTLIMDATQGQAVFDQAKAFHEAVAVGSVIITKLDGHAKGGGALSAVAATNSPITFLGGGEHFDDLEAFDAQSFVSRLLGFGDMKGLMQQIQESQEGSGDPKEMMERMSKGQFTLRDLYKQLSSAMKLGPMSKVMGMIPGMGDMAQMANNSGTQGMFKKNMYMMDSMTDDELDGKVDLSQSESRILRIARGSGTHPDEVRGLLKLHKHFEKVFGKVGKNMKGEASKVKQLQRNPALAKQHVSQMDPKVVESLGGRAKVLEMISNGGGPGGAGGADAQAAAMQALLGGAGGGMPSGGGMPGGGMADMMKMMGGAGGAGGGGMRGMADMMKMMGGAGGGGGGTPSMADMMKMMGGAAGGGGDPQGRRR